MVTVQVYFNETEFLNCWSIFRLDVIFQLDMGDLLVELELGASGRGGHPDPDPEVNCARLGT